MKKIILLLVISMAILSVNAQEKVKQKELGLVFQNFDNFGLMYKFGHQKSMWRLKSVYGNSDKREQIFDQEESTTRRFSGGLSFGKQFTVQIDKYVDFIYGGDLSLFYSKSSLEKESSDLNSQEQFEVEGKDYRFGFNVLVGFNYIINERIVIGAELLPGVSYVSGKTTKTTIVNAELEEVEEASTSGFNYGFSSSSVLLNLAYRF